MGPLSPIWAASGTAPFSLVVDGHPTADAWRATAPRERRLGLLGTEGLLGSDGRPGALWIEHCSSVHTFGMRYALDLAYLNRAGRVLATSTMARSRLGWPRLRARSVLEVPAGALREWRMAPGAVLSLRAS
jgi:uncharacterized membrane protein (UPF0127 family)